MKKVRTSQGEKENQNINSPKKLKRTNTNENLVLSSCNGLLNSKLEKNPKIIDTKGKILSLKFFTQLRNFQNTLADIFN